MASLLVVHRVDDFIVTIRLISIKILRLTTVAGVCDTRLSITGII